MYVSTIQNGHNHPVTQPGSIFRAKLWKVVGKYEIAMFFNFGVFLKMYIFEVATLLIQSTKFFYILYL